MNEIWRDIEGYEGLYQVSNLGRVKRLERKSPHDRRGGISILQEKILSPTDNGNGYKIISFRVPGSRKNYYVHRLVAQAFVANPRNVDYVNHIDRNRENNSADNLEWCTQAENIAHSAEYMRKPRAKCKPTNTGEKYIRRRVERRGLIRFRVDIHGVGICRNFKTLEEAIRFRNEVMQL